MGPNDDSALPQREMTDSERRQAYEAQRGRERTGINGAAEAGVFDPTEPPELRMVREAQEWQARQFEAANRGTSFTEIPTYAADAGPVLGAGHGETVMVPEAEPAGPQVEEHLTAPIDDDELAATEQAARVERARAAGVETFTPPMAEQSAVEFNMVNEGDEDE